MGYPLPKFNPIDRKEIFPFLSSAFPAFHQRSVENRNELKITFEYYLNARESSLVEGNFSNAFTMLERLASSYRKVGKPELAGISKTIRKQLRSKLSEHVNDMQEGGQLSSEAAETLNRRIDHIFSRQPTFLEMVSQLLTEYNVEFEDLFPDINRLQSLRNDIVHKGKVQSPSVFQDAQNLLKLLNRIVLAII